MLYSQLEKYNAKKKRTSNKSHSDSFLNLICVVSESKGGFAG